MYVLLSLLFPIRSQAQLVGLKPKPLCAGGSGSYHLHRAFPKASQTMNVGKLCVNDRSLCVNDRFGSKLFFSITHMLLGAPPIFVASFPIWFAKFCSGVGFKLA